MIALKKFSDRVSKTNYELRDEQILMQDTLENDYPAFIKCLMEAYAIEKNSTSKLSLCYEDIKAELKNTYGYAKSIQVESDTEEYFSGIVHTEESAKLIHSIRDQKPSLKKEKQAKKVVETPKEEEKISAKPKNTPKAERNEPKNEPKVKPVKSEPVPKVAPTPKPVQTPKPKMALPEKKVIPP